MNLPNKSQEPMGTISDVSSAMADLEKSVANLDEWLSNLQSRLSSITRQVPEEKVVGTVQPVSACELGESIRTQSRKIDYLATRISNHLNQLEI